MTAVIDPAGTPIPVFTRSGTVIVEVTPNGDDQGDATEIPNICGWQVVLVMAPTATDHAVKPHPDHDIGDVLEIYHVGGNSLPTVFAPDGQSMIGGSVSSYNGHRGLLLRKITATDWRCVGSY